MRRALDALRRLLDARATGRRPPRPEVVPVDLSPEERASAALLAAIDLNHELEVIERRNAWTRYGDGHRSYRLSSLMRTVAAVLPAERIPEESVILNDRRHAASFALHNRLMSMGLLMAQNGVFRHLAIDRATEFYGSYAWSDVLVPGLEVKVDVGPDGEPTYSASYKPSGNQHPLSRLDGFAAVPTVTATMHEIFTMLGPPPSGAAVQQREPVPVV